MSDALREQAERSRRDAQNRLWGVVRFGGPDPFDVVVSELRGLIERGARLELCNENDAAEGISPIHMAARGGDRRWIDVFSVLGIDLDARNSQGRSPAEEAALWGNDDFLLGLHQSGLDMRAHRTGELNCSLLHIAAAQGRRSTIGLLISLNCDPDASNDYGARPMHAAHSSPQIMAMLLAAGAEISPINRDFATPLGMTVFAKEAAGFAFLLEHGADPDSLSGGSPIRKSVQSISSLSDILRSFEASKAARSALLEMTSRLSP